MMAVSKRICYFLFCCSCCVQFHVDALSVNGSVDTCYDERNGLFPCSSTITGNLLLMICYGAILGVAAKFISDGAEMLLDFGLPPNLIGGVVLPVLGAVPDAAIILASGLGDDAQEQLSIGMGTLAGSTVMLLTIAWSASVVVGRCDLNANGESVDQTCRVSFDCIKQGVTLLPDIKANISIMLLTSILYLIVQSADWYWGATLVGVQPTYVSRAALATMILCLIGLAIYVIFSIFDSKRNERIAGLHKEELMKRKVLHTMLTLTQGEMFKSEESSPEDRPSVAKKYFKAWHVTTGSKDIKEKLGLLSEERDVESSSVDIKELPKTEESKWKAVLKCVCLLVGGVGAVTIFADPMCNVLAALTSKKNKSYIPIPSFYVSFVVTPFCSNASELVSSLIFASKKTKENATMTFSQLFGAATMNNTLCFGIFMALVYFKNLEWIYGAEVVCILAAQWIVGLISYTKTYKVWLGVPVGITYILCILIVWFLEYKAGWH